MKATDVIKDIAALIDRDGNFEVEIVPRYGGMCRSSRSILSIGGDGIGAIYLDCDVSDLFLDVNLTQEFSDKLVNKSLTIQFESNEELLAEVDDMPDKIAISYLKKALRDTSSIEVTEEMMEPIEEFIGEKDWWKNDTPDAIRRLGRHLLMLGAAPDVALTRVTSIVGSIEGEFGC